MTESNQNPLPALDPLGIAEAATGGAVQDPARLALLSVTTQETTNIAEAEADDTATGARRRTSRKSENTVKNASGASNESETVESARGTEQTVL